jgi:hypothetical protein
MREENMLFLRFLSFALMRHQSTIVIFCRKKEDQTSFPEFHLNWMPSPRARAPLATAHKFLGVVPGLVPHQLGLDFWDESVLLNLGSGGMLVAPELRVGMAATINDFDSLYTAASGVAWLAAYAQVHGSVSHAAPAFLTAQAQEYLADGGAGCALDLLGRAADVSVGASRAAILCQLQGVRIASHCFQAAATLPEPEEALPGGLKGFLFQSRGWGAVMSGDAEHGVPDLLRALELYRLGADGGLQPYLLNILALGMMRLGRDNTALELELSIAAENAGSGRSYPLHYVNSINIGRLLRQQGNFIVAEEAFRQAFSTHWGGRSESDLIYVNANIARLAQDSGRCSSKDWIRTALHFTAASVPEAFGRRHAGLFLGSAAMHGSREDVVEGVASILLEQLMHIEVGIKPLETSPVFFNRRSIPGDIGRFVLVGQQGWSAVAVEGLVSPSFDGPTMRRLRALLGGLLCGAAPECVSPTTSFLVDDRIGREMAQDIAEAMESAVRLGAERVIFDGEDIAMNESVRRVLELKSMIVLNDFVTDAACSDGRAIVRFRRYRPLLEIADPLGLVRAAAVGPVAIEDILSGCAWDDVRRELAKFESEGVLVRQLPSNWRLFVGPEDTGEKR